MVVFDNAIQKGFHQLESLAWHLDHLVNQSVQNCFGVSWKGRFRWKNVSEFTIIQHSKSFKAPTKKKKMQQIVKDRK